MRMLQAYNEDNSNKAICLFLTCLTHIKDSSKLTDVNNDGSITLMCDTFLHNIITLGSNDCIGLCTSWKSYINPFINSMNKILKELGD